MQDQGKTKEQLIDELAEMRRKMAEFENCEAAQPEVTQRKNQKDGLKQSEELYRSLFHNMLEGLAFCQMLFDDNGHPYDWVYIDVNPAFEKLTGLKNIVGKRVTEAIPGIKEAHPELFEIYGRVASRGQPEKFNIDFKPLGIKLNVAVFGFAKEYFVAVFENITELRRTKEDLGKREELLRSILDTSPVGIGLTQDRKIIWANEAWAKMFGFVNENEFLGQSAAMLYPSEEEYETSGRALYTDLETGNVSHAKIKFLRKDGSIFIADIRMKLIDPLASEKLAIAVLTDITDQIKAEEEKEALTGQLIQSQKMAAIGTLVGGIAHDFNNIFQIILSASQLMLAERSKDDPDYQLLEYIVNNVVGGADVVNRLLMFGKEATIRPVSVDLNHQIKGLTTLLSHTLPTPVEINMDLTDEPTRINADVNQIDQVIMNLAINASEAMPNGGRLNVSTKTVSLDDEHCSRHPGANPGNYVMLSVSDTGRGMDEETLARVFDPFFSSKPKSSTRGTGLGLSVVRGIVEQHGGHISYESEQGKGTEFKVYFPADV